MLSSECGGELGELVAMVVLQWWYRDGGVAMVVSRCVAMVVK